MIDHYSKAVLTVIAIALCVIAARMLYEPRAVTIGEVRDAGDKAAVIARVPMVRIQGGSVSADVSGSIDATVSQ